VTAGPAAWEVRLTAAAEADFHSILKWTVEQFGNAQARRYAQTLSAAIEALTAGPTVVGVQAREDIGKGLLTLHVARGGRKGRHFVLFRKDHSSLSIGIAAHFAGEQSVGRCGQG
jgi:toxin ParE1/3/4